MRNKHGDRFTENMKVYVRGGRKTETSFIQGWIAGVKGGVVLDAPIQRFRSWNIDELIPVPTGRKTKAEAL